MKDLEDLELWRGLPRLLVFGAVVGDPSGDAIDELARDRLVTQRLARAARQLEELARQRRRHRRDLQPLLLEQPAEQLRVLAPPRVLEPDLELRRRAGDRRAILVAERVPRPMRHDHAAGEKAELELAQVRRRRRPLV